MTLFCHKGCAPYYFISEKLWNTKWHAYTSRGQTKMCLIRCVVELAHRKRTCEGFTVRPLGCTYTLTHKGYLVMPNIKHMISSRVRSTTRQIIGGRKAVDPFFSGRMALPAAFHDDRLASGDNWF